MRRRRLFHTTLLIAACAILSSSGCGIYNPRHGMILRGDWSLEMNRVPWLNSRTKSYDEVGRGGGSEGMILQTPMTPENCSGASGMPGVRGAQPVAHRCPPSPMVCRTCTGLQAAASGAQPQQMAHSRFHPVPTRPVFTPWNCPTPDSRVHEPLRPQPPQVQPAPELIPTPSGSQSARKPTRADSPVKNAAWIFQPEDPSRQAIAAK